MPPPEAHARALFPPAAQGQGPDAGADGRTAEEGEGRLSSGAKRRNMSNFIDTKLDILDVRPHSGLMKPGRAPAALLRRCHSCIEAGGERVWRFSDFPNAPVAAVGQALSRLARDGTLQPRASTIARGRPPLVQAVRNPLSRCANSPPTVRRCFRQASRRRICSVSPRRPRVEVKLPTRSFTPGDPRRGGASPKPRCGRPSFLAPWRKDERREDTTSRTFFPERTWPLRAPGPRRLVRASPARSCFLGEFPRLASVRPRSGDCEPH